MKITRKVFWLTVSCLSLMIFACVTINIYFPAEEVKSVAGKIVDDIRGMPPPENTNPGKDQNSFLRYKSLAAFFCPRAFAEEALNVSNATIRSLKQQMKSRYPLMKPYYEKGILQEQSNGYVALANPGGLSLKERRDLQNLVNAENGDRKLLYAEVAKALKIDPSQVNRVAEIFAKEWQKSVR